MEMELPEGRKLSFGRDQAVARPARLKVERERFFSRCLLYGDVGFGESYVDGDWDSADLVALLKWVLLNLNSVPGLAGSGKGTLGWNLLQAINRCAHWARDNSRRNSRRNIAAHYDLSNELFATFLDPGMTYSSACFGSADPGLEAAQESKYARLSEKLNLHPGAHLLEIGCGWGGFAIHAARTYGCRVTAVTLSQRQLEVARARVREAGLEGEVRVELSDYRDLRGKFDAIASIEMLEAVGHRHLKGFFLQCHRLLQPSGLLGLQVITLPDSRYDASRRSVDWIQRHIVPGGQCLSISAIQTAINRTGDLVLQHLESFGLHYAETLRRWRESFEERVPEVLRLGFDGRFVRTWRYYLSYCEAAFAMRNISVIQAFYTRPNNTSWLTPVEARAAPILAHAHDGSIPSITDRG